ncbi:MAG: dephospho-CoA kinase [Brevinema sp.]
MVIALYAPVGSGKSTVLQRFYQNGWTTINQDDLTHQLLNTLSLEIEQLFGSDVIENGLPSRQKLGAKVFSDAAKLQQLEDLLYPLIHQKTRSLIQGNTLIEGANLYKVLHEYPIDKTLTIFVPLDILRQRLTNRGHSKEWIDRVITAQKPLFDAQKQADLSLDNSGSLENLYQHIDSLLTEFSTL